MIKSLQKLFNPPKSVSEKEITNLYILYKESFIGYFLKNHSVERDVVEDIYHDSFIALYQSVHAGKIQEHTSLKSYLFGIGLKKMMKYFEQQKKLPQVIMADIPDFIENDNSSGWIEKQEIVNKVVEEMGRKCKQVLSLYYWEHKSMREIAEYMNYQGEQVAKNKKHSCMQELKAQLKDIFRKEGWI